MEIGNKTGKDIIIKIGICQGDYLLAMLFILHLAFALKPIPDTIVPEDCSRTLWSCFTLVDWWLQCAQSQNRSLVCRWHIVHKIRQKQDKWSRKDNPWYTWKWRAPHTLTPPRQKGNISAKMVKPAALEVQIFQTFGLDNTEHDINRRKGLAIDSLKQWIQYIL